MGDFVVSICTRDKMKGFIYSVETMLTKYIQNFFPKLNVLIASVCICVFLSFLTNVYLSDFGDNLLSLALQSLLLIFQWMATPVRQLGQQRPLAVRVGVCGRPAGQDLLCQPPQQDHNRWGPAKVGHSRTCNFYVNFFCLMPFLFYGMIKINKTQITSMP